MNTNLADHPFVSCCGTPGVSRLAGFCRTLLVTLCVSLVALASTSKALAGGADGKYQFTSISGSLEVVGGNVPPPLSAVKKLLGVTRGKFIIQNNTIKLNKSATVDFVKNLTDDPDYTLTTKVTGPTSLVLTKSRTSYHGEILRPIVTSFTGTFHDTDIAGKLVTNLSATVSGNRLKLVLRFSGKINEGNFSGKMILVGKR